MDRTGKDKAISASNYCMSMKWIIHGPMRGTLQCLCLYYIDLAVVIWSLGGSAVCSEVHLPGSGSICWTALAFNEQIMLAFCL